MRKDIEWLLQSNIPAYEIEKVTGVARPIVSRLRRGDALLDNTTLANAEKLARYAKEQKNNCSKT